MQQTTRNVSNLHSLRSEIFKRTNNNIQSRSIATHIGSELYVLVLHSARSTGGIIAQTIKNILKGNHCFTQNA